MCRFNVLPIIQFLQADTSEIGLRFQYFSDFALKTYFYHEYNYSKNQSIRPTLRALPSNSVVFLTPILVIIRAL